MDTSIIVVIAIVVVFAVAVPAMIRKSATELSRVEIDTVPDEATVISAETQNPCRNEGSRIAVFQPGGARTPKVPRPDVVPHTQAPALRLSAPTPDFVVIDGLAADAAARNSHTDAGAEADARFQPDVLPVAVGETHSPLGSAAHEAATGSGSSAPSSSTSTGNVRMLHPAVQAVFNKGHSDHTGSAAAGRGAPGAHRAPRPAETTATSRSTSRGNASAFRSDVRLGGEANDTTGRGPRNSNPKLTADEEHSMTEKATQVRESMSSLGAMIRGFALLFLGSALGILVTGVLTMFSVVHISLVGVFFGLAVVSLVIVRTLNLRKREVKARLREAERTPASGSKPQRSTTAQRATAQRQASAESATATQRPTAKAGSGATPEAGPATTAKAAQARAAMQHSVTAEQAREEADTGEIPLVRVRSEAAEGHTTRQVLLTKPISIVEEKTTEADSTPAAEATPDTGAADTTVEAEETTPAAESATASANEDEVHAALDAASPRVDDPFMQRLKSRDGWSPTPLPVPSYVDAAQIEHPVPAATAADASSYEDRSHDSYEMQARSREDIAAQFAAELGYRPELSDSAREEGPLEHGRKATRTRKTADLGAVNDVLARRRA